MKPTRVNLNYFKVFMAVYQTKSMTAAADMLHLTQSSSEFTATCFSPHISSSSKVT